jgi:hypothetical protein
MRTKIIAATLFCVLPTAVLAEEATIPVFDISNFATSQPNPYFPLTQGESHVLTGTIQDGGSSLPFSRSRTVLGSGPMVLGVETVMMLDEEFKNGLITERTIDYYAPDKDGTIWYFGEDVTNYAYDDAGTLTKTEAGSSWRAGKNDAQPGIVMLAAPQVGSKLFLAHAPVEEEMEFSQVESISVDLTVPTGSYADVIQLYIESQADPDLRELTFWAKDVGLIRFEEDLSPQRDKPKVQAELTR